MPKYQELSPAERLELITRRLPEHHGTNDIESILQTGGNPKGIWVTVPTGRPHLGYFVPLLKMVDFLRAGVDFNVCLGDIYGFLINFKYPWDQVQQRKRFYKYVLGAVFESIGVPSAELLFIEESSYALTPGHILDVYKLCALSSQHQIRATGDEVGASTMFGPMLTPVLQALDEEYQKSDFDFGGLDQRGLFEYAEHFLPQMKFRKRAHLMNDMLPGLNGGKMSASLPDSKIDCLDSPEVVRQKIAATTCDRNDPANNGLLALVRLVLLPISELRLERSQGQTGYSAMEGTGNCSGQRPFCSVDAPPGTLFTVELETPDKTDHRHYQSYDEVERDYLDGTISEHGLKEAITGAINQLLGHVRSLYAANPDWQAVEKEAYPSHEEEFISTHGAGKNGMLPNGSSHQNGKTHVNGSAVRVAGVV